jgi:hypothetical protein
VRGRAAPWWIGLGGLLLSPQREFDIDGRATAMFFLGCLVLVIF